jgi:outer membrane receptor protein involved in Fe transport
MSGMKTGLLKKRQGGPGVRASTLHRGVRCVLHAVLRGGVVVGQLALAAEGDLEEVVVTGSRIARPDFQSASPILSLSEQRFERASSNTVEGVLNTLPQFVPAFGSTSNNPSNGGQANLSLRGLPTTSTLVLLDGRRLMPANGNGVADVNIIPPALIESVEVITGGASAVYGSDAIAGVVNFKLRHEFDSIELDAMGGLTEQGDGQEYSVSVSGGADFADNRGSIVGFAGYSSRSLVTYADRDFSRYALVWFGPQQGTLGPQRGFIAGGSNTILEGRAVISGVDRDAFSALFTLYGAPGAIYQPSVSFNEDRTLFTPGFGLQPPRQGGVANFRGTRDPVAYNDRLYAYNYAPFNALQMPLDRTSLFGRAEFAFNESAQLYAQGLYSSYSVAMRLAPTPVSDVSIPVTNPYVPADLVSLLATRDDPAPFEFSKRMLDIGPRTADQQYEVYQFTAGLQGALGAGWRYDGYFQLGRNNDEETQSNNVLRSKFMDLTYASDGGAALCGGYDPFGLAPITPACAAYMSVDGTNRSDVSQDIVELAANGPVFSVPAGEVQLAVGVMYKRDEYTYRSDPVSKIFLDDGFSDIQGFNPALDIVGRDHNMDVYFEASLPLLRDVRGARSLDTVVGYRVSNYASAGNVDAYKAELLYEPVDPVRIRGSFQRAVRAPSVYELYLPQLGPVVFLDGAEPDPCVAGSSARTGDHGTEVTALCGAQGIPSALLPTYSYDSDFAPGVAGGNPDLKPEAADTLTAGVVLRPSSSNRWLQPLQVSIDWYRIEVDDAIKTPFVASAVTRCYDATFNPAFAVDNAYCEFFRRDPVSGNIVDAKEIYRNVGLLSTSGIDLQIDWKVDVGPGTVSANWLASWVDSFKVSDGPGLKADEHVGTVGFDVGGSFPEWKWNLRADYSWAGVSVGAQWRFIDGMRDADPETQFDVPSRDYFDVFAGYDFEDGTLAGLSVHAGVENLTDEAPPIFPSYVQANTDPSQYDTLGRRYYARLTYRF